MKPTLLVSGCSITHGAELYNGFMSPENIKQSFSAELAKRLNLNLVNVALSGGSNEYIFHSVIEEIYKHANIETVIVIWTSRNRFYWKKKNRHWFILPNWASSISNLENFQIYDKTINGVWYTSDSDEVLENLENIHKFFVLNYFDNIELIKKLNHYKKALTEICKSENIKLISMSTAELEHIGNWFNKKRHPNAQEHLLIADFIHKRFYGDNNVQTG